MQPISLAVAAAALGGLVALLSGCSPAPSAPAASSGSASGSSSFAAPAATALPAARDAISAVAQKAGEAPGAAAAPPAAPLLAPGGAGGASAPQVPPLAASPVSTPQAVTTDRMVIYTTEVALLADNLASFQADASRIVSGYGGYVAGVETKTEAIPSVTVRLKVPPTHYDDMMREVASLARQVRDQKATTQDVTENFDDTQTQVISLEAQEAQLVELMKRTNSVDELLKVQQQANQVKLQLDRLKGHATALARQTSLASINLTVQLSSAVLPRDFVATRTALRKAQAEQASIEAELRQTHTVAEQNALRDRLADALVQVQTQQAKLDDIQARAQAAGIALPELSAADAAALNRTTEQSTRSAIQLPRSVRAAWDASLTFLVGVLSVLVFLWWLIPLAAIVLLARSAGLFRNLGLHRGAPSPSA